MRRTHPHGMLLRLGLHAATAASVSCSDGSGPVSGTCPQTFEFGNVGCARVEGVVRDAAGTPLANARVSLFPADEVPNSFDSPSDDTDATGAYSLEIHDFGGDGRDAPPSEPVPMNLRAFLLTGSPEEPGPASDLIPVNLQFAPVGEVPEVLQVDITIDVGP
ncbi:MAG TPA: carboxypeptidase-like regulatory domain-containing protein [Thermomicrobiales bacterium]|nr:carboxypeptidase-like regulatory domain-containing protein [Thermomicrobiales bacterium]